MSEPQEHKAEYDPVYLHAKKEAQIILWAWFVCLIWTVGYCAVFGYGIETDELKLFAGVPSWVFWGVVVPWIVATVFSVWFGLFFMKDDELN